MINVLENVVLEGFIAIIPSVCVGNVGQLAADLIIHSLNLKKLGFVWHPSVISLAGSDPYGSRHNTVSLGLEIFYSCSLKIIVFQIRTTIIDNNSFVQDLVSWLIKNKLKQIIVLTGSSAHERRDEQLIGKPLRFLFCPNTKKLEYSKALERKWIEFENVNISNDSSCKFSLPYMPGSGFALKLFKNCCESNMPCSVLIMFCSDGNNAPDAMDLADYVNEWLKLKEKQKLIKWTIPPSWNLVFGSCPPLEIFN